jgi:hypothetical protein
MTQDLLFKLEAIEEIRALKARYCRAMDTKDWAALQAVFAPDALFDMRSGAGEAASARDVYRGAETIVAFMRASVEPLVTAHHVFAPEIDILSEGRASAVWAMQDLLIAPADTPLPFRRLYGAGHYHETYVRLQGRWVIQSLRLSRLHVETHSP